MVEEDFLVLAGTCLLLVEDEERELRAWDFVHCPAGTRHSFVTPHIRRMQDHTSLCGLPDEDLDGDSTRSANRRRDLTARGALERELE